MYEHDRTVGANYFRIERNLRRLISDRVAVPSDLMLVGEHENRLWQSPEYAALRM